MIHHAVIAQLVDVFDESTWFILLYGGPASTAAAIRADWIAFRWSQ